MKFELVCQCNTDKGIGLGMRYDPNEDKHYFVLRLWFKDLFFYPYKIYEF